MTPTSVRHGRWPPQIAFNLLQIKPDIQVVCYCPIQTKSGVKVPDVAYLSKEFFDRYGYTSPLPEAPEICVEIISPSNSQKEIEQKLQLYFSSGAKEVWTCNLDGELQFYTSEGQIQRSSIIPGFPQLLSTD